VNILLKLEYAALFLVSIALFAALPYAWWWYPVLLLVPDVGMIGYLINPRIGAFTYNVTHWLPVGLVLVVIGTHHNLPLLTLAGVILLGHSAMDRMLGFGLKYRDSFKHTHLGTL
jgi:hypothetical protein